MLLHLSIVLLAATGIKTVACTRTQGYNSDQDLSDPGSVPDPRGEIICRGLPPSWLPFTQIPQETSTNIQSDLLHSLCASSRYGGKPGENAGGYCRGGVAEPSMIFDIEEAREDLFNPRVLTYCRARCTCSEKPENYGHKEMSWRAFSERIGNQQTLLAFLDLFTGSVQIYHSDQAAVSPTNVGIPLIMAYGIHMDVPAYLGGKSGQRLMFVMPNSGTPPICRPHVLDHSVVPREFADLSPLKLCTARSAGGNSDGNSGGVCLPTIPESSTEIRTQLYFFDELAHPKLQPWNYPMGAGARIWCTQNCYCSSPRDNIRGLEALSLRASSHGSAGASAGGLYPQSMLGGGAQTFPVVPFFPVSPMNPNRGHWLPGRGPSLYSIREGSASRLNLKPYLSSSSSPTRRRRQRKPPAKTPSTPWTAIFPPAGGLTINGITVIPAGGFPSDSEPAPFSTKWPDTLPPPPSHRKTVRESGWEAASPVSLKTEGVLAQCGAGKCDGPSSCGAECSCVARYVDGSGVEAGRAGLDPVFPVAGCVAVALLQVTRKGGLLGRGLAEKRGEACVCNASYVSEGCCGSVDGMVWEDPGGRLGRLDVEGEDL